MWRPEDPETLPAAERMERLLAAALRAEEAALAAGRLASVAEDEDTRRYWTEASDRAAVQRDALRERARSLASTLQAPLFS